jgi:outer membrane beta-barrel protein
MRNRVSLAGIALMGMAAVLFLGCFPAGTARAENIPYSLSITPFAGGYVFEGNQHMTDRAVYGVSIGYNVTEHWALEATYSAVPDAITTNSNQTGGTPGVAKKLTVHEVRGDVLYHFFPDQRLVPYIAAGAGWIFIVPQKGATDDDVLVDYGAGLKFFLTDRIALRADVRHIFDVTYHDTARPRDFYNNFAYTGGVTFQLGGVKPAARVVEEPKPVQAVTPPPPAPEETTPVPPPAPEPAVAPIEAPAPAPVQETPLTLTAEQPEVAAAAAPAGTILLTGITIDKDSLEIVTTKHLGTYKTFTLSQPSRLVIDVAGAANALGVKRIPVHRFGITAVRFGDHPDFLRIVLDAAQGRLLPYRIEETSKGLKIIMTNP